MKNFTCPYCKNNPNINYINDFAQNCSCNCRGVVYKFYYNGNYIIDLNLHATNYKIQIYYSFDNVCYKFIFLKLLNYKESKKYIDVILDLTYAPEHLDYQNPANLIDQLNSLAIFQ